jgi:hypothetical protein
MKDHSKQEADSILICIRENGCDSKIIATGSFFKKCPSIRIRCTSGRLDISHQVISMAMGGANACSICTYLILVVVGVVLRYSFNVYNDSNSLYDNLFLSLILAGENDIIVPSVWLSSTK